MAHYEFTYFDFDGGRGEPVRIALHAAGIPFEDHRLSFEQFGKERTSLPFNAVPVLAIDNVQVSQSNAQGRYVGKLAGLYPVDALQALYCDEVVGALEDINHYIVQTFGLEGEALREAREKLVHGRLGVFLTGLDALLQRGGGEFYAGNSLTIADLKSMVQIRAITSGKLDHIPADLVSRLAPALAAHQLRIEKEPRVVAYYQSRQAT